ncbi:MAG: hypothetical protein AAF411_02045 [Myxococcota bacterium]
MARKSDLHQTYIDRFEVLRAVGLPPLLEKKPSISVWRECARNYPALETQIQGLIACAHVFDDHDDALCAREALDRLQRWIAVRTNYRKFGLPGHSHSTITQGHLYHAAAAALSRAPELHEEAVGWIEWAQSLGPRNSACVNVHARLLFALGRRDEGLQLVARYRRRYADHEEMRELYETHKDALDAVQFNDARNVRIAMMKRGATIKDVNYIVGRIDQIPPYLMTPSMILDALIEAIIPDDHAMMRRLLVAVGKRDESEHIRHFLKYTEELSPVPETVIRALRFAEGTGHQGWELIVKALPEDPPSHWIEGAWAYLDGFGPRESFMLPMYEAALGTTPQLIEMAKHADPDWQRIRDRLDRVEPTLAQKLAPYLPNAILTSLYLRLAEEWLETHVPEGASAIAAWLRGEDTDEDVLLGPLLDKPGKKPAFTGAPSKWKRMPEGELGRRAGMLAAQFDPREGRTLVARLRVDPERLAISPRLVSRPVELMVLLEARAKRLRHGALVTPPAATERTPEAESTHPETRAVRTNQRLEHLFLRHPEAAKRATSWFLRQAGGPHDDALIRALKYMTDLAPETYGDWVGGLKPRRKRLREWINAWKKRAGTADSL